MSELPSPLQLVDAPELAALHLLEAALATVERALLAAYPELEDGLCLERPACLSTEAWLADAIIVHVTGLETALFHYRFQPPCSRTTEPAQLLSPASRVGPARHPR